MRLSRWKNWSNSSTTKKRAIIRLFWRLVINRWTEQKMVQKIRTKKVIIDQRESGGIVLRKIRSSNQKIKVKILLRKGMSRFTLNIYLVDDFLKFFGTGSANFIILFVEAINAFANLDKLVVVLFEFRAKNFDLSDYPLDVFLETKNLISLFVH
jgi:hypothetical protein